MKTSRRLSLVLGHSSLLLSTAAFLVAADDAALRPIAFQTGINQQSLGAETAEIAKAINDLIDELQRNGFPVQSLSGLSELATQLNALGGSEMTAIAARLRKLGENAQADPRATATEAYLAQQAIETRLKSLARQISIQQLREESARRLEALIVRQVATQRETRAIASAPANAERQRILESDQIGIGEDLLTFFQTGENLLARLRDANPSAAAPTDSGAAPATPSFADRINGTYLTTLSNEATEFIRGKRYPEAYGRQGALIVELRKILQGILSSLPKEQRLASALQQVSALRQRAEAEAANAENNQAVADQAQTLANQVASLSPEAANALNRAAQQALQPPQQTPDRPSTPNQPPSGDQASNPPRQQPGQPQPTPPQPGQNQPSQPQPGDVASTPPQPGQQQPGDQQPGQPQPSQPQPGDVASNPPQPGQQQPGQPEAGQPQPGQQQPGQQQPGQPQPGDVAATPQPGQPGQQQPGQNQPGQQQPGQQQPSQPGQQPSTPSAAAQSLAAAEAALQRALAQAQAAAGQNQPGQNQPGQNQTAQNQQGQNQQGQQQAGAQQSGQQSQQGQPPGPNQQGQQQQTGPLNAQFGQDGRPPTHTTESGVGGTQGQIPGHGPANAGPAQVVGALRHEEREAFTALQGERYPAEYSAWVQQYWRNLAQEQ